MDHHIIWMQTALREAEKAFEKDEVPVGAVVVQGDRLVGKGYNQIETLQDPTAHAEMIALTAAANTLQSWRLENCAIYVTLEPCAMCAGALVLARIKSLIFAADDPKAGACGSLRNLLQDQRLNHQVEIVSGVLQEKSALLLKAFFDNVRKTKRNQRLNLN
jgi:tRNA(adenine34) deaminase